MRKFISMLTALALAISLTACADKGNNSENGDNQGTDDGSSGGVIALFPFTGTEGIEYTLNDDGKSYSASGIGTCEESEIVISRGFNTLPVTAVADGAFAGCEGIESVRFSEGVAVIGEGAFEGCRALREVVFPSTITTLKDKAFCNTAIEQFRLPTKISYVGSSVFESCTSLTYASLSESMNEVGAAMFANCTALTTVVLGSKTVMIKANAFNGCELLQNLRLPSTLFEIEAGAFRGCPSLYRVEYLATESDWAAVRIGSGNELLIDAIVFNGLKDK